MNNLRGEQKRKKRLPALYRKSSDTIFCFKTNGHCLLAHWFHPLSFSNFREFGTANSLSHQIEIVTYQCCFSQPIGLTLFQKIETEIWQTVNAPIPIGQNPYLLPSQKTVSRAFQTVKLFLCRLLPYHAIWETLVKWSALFPIPLDSLRFLIFPAQVTLQIVFRKPMGCTCVDCCRITQIKRRLSFHLCWLNMKLFVLQRAIWLLQKCSVAKGLTPF